MLKKIITIGFFILPMMLIHSQSRHEISVSTAGELFSTGYYSNNRESENKSGEALGFGLGYNYRITKKWSIGSGVEIRTLRSEYGMDNISDSYTTNDGEDDFIFHTTIKEYKENQNVSYLNIPLVMMFEQPMSKKRAFFASTGLKFGIPVIEKVDINASFDNYGYYPKWENPIKDNPYFMGFGEFKSENKKGNLELQTLYSLSVESGIKWILGNKLNLYSGIYCDYGLNNIQKVSNKRIIQYNQRQPSDYIHNSAVNSSYLSEDGSLKTFIDKSRIMVLGIKIKMAFNL